MIDAITEEYSTDKKRSISIVIFTDHGNIVYEYELSNYCVDIEIYELEQTLKTDYYWVMNIVKNNNQIYLLSKYRQVELILERPLIKYKLDCNNIQKDFIDKLIGCFNNVKCYLGLRENIFENVINYK